MEPDFSWRSTVIQRGPMDTSCRAGCYTRPEQVPSNLNYSTVNVTSPSSAYSLGRPGSARGIQCCPIGMAKQTQTHREFLSCRN